MKNLIIEIKEDLHKALKVKAAQEGKTQKQLVTELLQNYVNK